MAKRTYWVYIMTNRSGTLYTGFTNDLARRIHEHRHRLIPGFASRYRIDRLIHVEAFSEVRDAIAREKQIKAWRRSHKLALIAATNPDWRDLGEEWFGAKSDHKSGLHLTVHPEIRGNSASCRGRSRKPRDSSQASNDTASAACSKA